MREVRTRSRRRTRKSSIERETRLLDWEKKGHVSALIDDHPTVIDRGIPGELVVAAVDRGRRPWRGTVREVIAPAPERVAPSCPYYVRNCGGCQWQHARYDAQLRWKREAVSRELRRADLSADVVAHGMADPWRYRRTAAIAIGWEAGFRPRGRRGIVEVRDCPISHPLIGHLSDAMNDTLRAGLIPNYHGKVWLECTVVGSEAEPQLQVLIQGIEGLTVDSHPELPDVARRVARIPGVGSVAFRHRSGEPFALVGDLMSRIEVAGRSMWLPAGSFFQTNLCMLPELIDRMRAVIERSDVRAAADVYGGVGTFALFLADAVASMTLLEVDPRAVDAAIRTAADWGLTNLQFVSRHAERALTTLRDLDLVIVDPPRSGLGRQVVDTLVAKRPAFLLYVSCSPASLARDLSGLVSGGFHLDAVEIFDFYPQTYHVESLAILRQ